MDTPPAGVVRRGEWPSYSPAEDHTHGTQKTLHWSSENGRSSVGSFLGVHGIVFTTPHLHPVLHIHQHVSLPGGVLEIAQLELCDLRLGAGRAPPRSC